jgi:GNAT superfamily N-acetyltransferase
MRIRPARSADAGAINVLLDQLGYSQDGHATTAARIQAWVDDQASAVFVADANGDLLGVIAVHIYPFFVRDGTSGRIAALVVADQARGRGVGSRLVEVAESFAASHGCLRMEVTSGDRRPGAHRFYQRRGYANQAGTSSRFLRDLPYANDSQIDSCQNVDSRHIPADPGRSFLRPNVYYTPCGCLPFPARNAEWRNRIRQLRLSKLQ